MRTVRRSRYACPDRTPLRHHQLPLARSVRAGALAADLYHHSRTKVRPGELVCTLGFTSADYVTVDLACARLGAVVVPLQHSAAASQLAPVVAEHQSPRTGDESRTARHRRRMRHGQCRRRAGCSSSTTTRPTGTSASVFDAAANRLRESACTIEMICCPLCSNAGPRCRRRLRSPMTPIACASWPAHLGSTARQGRDAHRPPGRHPVAQGSTEAPAAGP